MTMPEFETTKHELQGLTQESPKGNGILGNHSKGTTVMKLTMVSPIFLISIGHVRYVAPELYQCKVQSRLG